MATVTQSRSCSGIVATDYAIMRRQDWKRCLDATTYSEAWCGSRVQVRVQYIPSEELEQVNHLKFDMHKLPLCTNQIQLIRKLHYLAD